MYESFLGKMVEVASRYKIGNPLDEATDIGTLIGRDQFEKVCGYIEDGLSQEEARVMIGGMPPAEGPLTRGYYMPPTIFAGAKHDWRLAREEIFGPVLVVIPWKDEADVIRMTNDSIYGLSGHVWTYNIGTALRTAHAIESGWIQVNLRSGTLPGHSYGGYKQSGVGTEFSLESMLDGLTHRKVVTVNLAR
ncbi:aldehyde dehydrogenase family protein [Chloroflexota bacterium]